MMRELEQNPSLEDSPYLEDGPNTSTKDDLKGKESLLTTKNKRRSKKDKEGRVFVCGCGKEYLSYPALYTHIKTKHEGKQPEGTRAHQPTTNKRGRPRLNKQDDNISKPLGTIPQPYNIINTESNIRPDDFNTMADFVVDTDLGIIHDYKLSGKCDPTEGFYVDQLGEEKKSAYHPFHAIINRLKLDNKPDHFDNNHICDYVIALFLFYVSKTVNAKLYRLLGIFFRHLREALNEYGYQEVETFYKEGHSDEARMHIPQKKPGRDFTQEEDVHYLPLITNRFLSDYLPEKCPDFDQELALSLINDFNGWLFRKKLTKIKLAFSQGC